MPYIGTSPSNGVRRVYTYTATASQTTFSGASNEGSTLAYVDNNYLDVYQNGILLGSADYTSTTGTSVVLAQAASVDDIIVIVAYDVFSVADTVSKTDGGTFDGNVTMGGTLAVTGNTTLSGNLTLTGTPTGNFITHIDQYRIIGSFDTDNNPLGSGTPANNTIERNDTTGVALLGTAMTNSSGIFSFPTTGLWRVETSVYYKADASTNDGGLKTDIQLTTDNSSYNTVARGSGNSHNTSLAAEDSVYVQIYLDITNTSTHKVKFTSDSTGNANTTIQGDTNISKTWFCFTRFGDT